MFEEVFAGEFARSALPKLLELADHWLPDVIVRETCEFASVLAAEAIGVPDVHVACFLAVARRARLRHLLADGAAAPRVRPAAGRARPQRGALPDARPARARAPELPRVRRAPAASARPRCGRARCPTGGTARRDPLVYVSFGSAAAGNGFFPDVYRGAIDALADGRCACC